jgi:hypothetical protein
LNGRAIISLPAPVAPERGFQSGRAGGMIGALETGMLRRGLMRFSTTLLVIGMLTIPLAMAEPAIDYVSLDGPNALEQVQQSNPRHYAIIRRVLADASEICRAREPEVIAMKFDARDVNCGRDLWLTSNPPKRVLQFRIDNTFYSARVVVNYGGAKLRLVH